MKIISLDNLKYILTYLKTRYVAPRATSDELGNNINETYLTKNGTARYAVHADDASTARAVAWNNIQDKPEYLQDAGIIKEKDGQLATKDFNGKVPTMDRDGALAVGEAIHLHHITDTDDTAATIKFDPATGITSDAQIHAYDAQHVAWDSVDGKPTLFPPENHNHDSEYIKKTDASILASSLSVRKTLGTEEVPYVMDYHDFDKIGVYEIVNGTAAALPKDVTGVFYIFNMCGELPETATLLGTSPKDGILYTGQFLSGSWLGWKSVANSGNSLRVNRDLQDGNRAQVLVGCDPDKEDGIAGGWAMVRDGDGNLIFSNAANSKDSCAMYCDASQQVHVEKPLVVKSFNIPTQDNGEGNIWIS